MNNIEINSISRIFLWFFFVFCLYSLKAFCQPDTKKIDSFKRLIEKAKTDTDKVKDFIALSKITSCEDTRQKISYTNEALQLAVKINWEKGVIDANIIMGWIYAHCEKNYLNSIIYLEKAVSLAKKSSNKLAEALAKNLIANDYKNLSQYRKSIEFYTQVVELNADPDLKLGALGDMGIIYKTICDYPNALSCYDSSLKILDASICTTKNSDVSDTIQRAGLLINIGDIYLDMHDFDKALENYQIVQQLSVQTNNKYLSLYALSGIAKTYQLGDNFIQALASYKKALMDCKELNEKKEETGILDKMGKICLATGDTDEAMRLSREALQLAQENNYAEWLPECYNTLGKIQTAFKVNKKAITYLEKAIYLCKQTGELEIQLDALNSLSDAYKQAGQPALALDAFKQYITIRDTLYNISKAKELNRIDLKSEYERKQMDENVAQAKKDADVKLQFQKQRVFTYGGFTALALVILLAFFIYSNYAQQKKANVVIRAEKENAEQQRQRAERSDAFKQQFLANMSHEIRTPMNAVMGMTTLALESPVPDKQKIYLEGIKKSSDNLLHIINDILDLSKIEAGKMELEEIDFSLAATLEQVKQVLSYRAEEKGLQLVTYIDPAVPDVAVGDPVRLGQALLNLAGNGIKFTEQGSVSIKVKKVTDGVRFSVTDTGIGIPKDKLELVFEKFSQANSSDTRKYGGTGLGLSISQQLVELMGGHIAIESVEGSGTTFSFILNLPMGSEERLKQRISAEEDVDGSALDGLSILVVDDNEYNRIVARDTLEAKAKVKIDAVGSAKEGLALLQQKHFDMVLMDVQMPVMNGFDATRYIREQMEGPVKDIPVIALTASVLRTDLDQCKAAGMNAYVSKPFKASQLIGAIAEVLGLNTRAGMPVQSREPKLPSATSVTDLTYLATYCEGDKERMAGYINMYLKAAGGFEEKVKAAINTGEAEDAAALAHAFKPKWKMMGMALCVDLGQKVEFMSKEAGNEEHIKNALLRLTEYNRQSVMELESFV